MGAEFIEKKALLDIMNLVIKFFARTSILYVCDGNTRVGTNECGGNQFVPINGGEKK